ncbi:MAG: hypothetical protein CMM52_05030 [Rhodospirillaceae bacterium]|nr:hypothetical protein [Rhodospirillaceae bacterium]|tara:strand:- start:7059 stop:7931 length:873 start_codon:yes stop_codon:yes gene_type:complete
MAARISHVALNSNTPTPVATMYETVFGLELDTRLQSPELGEVLSDGNILLNIRPRIAGHRVGLDHFGIEVDDIESTFEKLKTDYPKIGWVKQPEDGANGEYFAHDPAGSIFALSQASDFPSEARPADRPVSANFARWSDGNPSERYVQHYAIRTRKLEECADFYEDVFGFDHRSPFPEDPNHYLSDGRVTLILIQWSINDYGGISVTGRGPDHIAFKVEDGAKVQAEIEGYSTHFAPGNAPMWLLTTVNRTTEENQIRAQMVADSNPVCQYQFTDRDGTFVVISDKTLDN